MDKCTKFQYLNTKFAFFVLRIATSIAKRCHGTRRSYVYRYLTVHEGSDIHFTCIIFVMFAQTLLRSAVLSSGRQISAIRNAYIRRQQWDIIYLSRTSTQQCPLKCTNNIYICNNRSKGWNCRWTDNMHIVSFNVASGSHFYLDFIIAMYKVICSCIVCSLNQRQAFFVQRIYYVVFEKSLQYLEISFICSVTLVKLIFPIENSHWKSKFLIGLLNIQSIHRIKSSPVYQSLVISYQIKYSARFPMYSKAHKLFVALLDVPEIHTTPNLYYLNRTLCI